jgi:hypothetical protein
MLDPVFLHNLTHSRPVAELLAQLTRLDPELTVEAVLPLLAARLMGADAANDDDEAPPEPELVSA